MTAQKAYMILTDKKDFIDIPPPQIIKIKINKKKKKEEKKPG